MKIVSVNGLLVTKVFWIMIFHDMETLSILLDFMGDRRIPVTMGGCWCDIFCVVSLKWLNRQSSCQWCGAPCQSCDVAVMINDNDARCPVNPWLNYDQCLYTLAVLCSESHTLGKRHDDVMKWKLFRVTGHLCGEFTGPRWIPHIKTSDAELWWFLWSASE